MVIRYLWKVVLIVRVIIAESRNYNKGQCTSGATLLQGKFDLGCLLHVETMSGVSIRFRSD
jgi:hypothetical protein